MKKPSLPTISIITPSYNQGKFIRETIDSVLSQNYPNLEYWVIDGGSTDDTVKILKSYGDKIKWVSEKDGGQTEAINKGMKMATGEVVAYLNSDDAYLPNTFMTVAETFAASPESQWLTGDYFIIDEKGKKIQSYVATYKKFLRKYPTTSVLNIANFVIQPSTFWRRSLFAEIGYFDESLRYCMDYEYWMRAIRKYPPVISARHFSLFRIHGNSKGGSLFQKQFAEEHEILKRFENNPLVLGLHWLHAAAIVAVYKLIK